MVPTYCVPSKSFWTWKNVKQDTMEALNEILDHFVENDWDLALVYYEPVDAIGTVNLIVD